MSETAKVYAAISAVSKELAVEGIAKLGRNKDQSYSFRGIDQVLASLAGLLPKHQLLILPRIVARSDGPERKTKGGAPIVTSVVSMAFDLVSVEDGSVHTVGTVGEAMDMADKATNKAMSAAYKYMAILTFCIPVVGIGGDGDETTPELEGDAERKAAEEAAAKAKQEYAEAVDRARKTIAGALDEEGLREATKNGMQLTMNDPATFADIKKAITERALALGLPLKERKPRAAKEAEQPA